MTADLLEILRQVRGLDSHDSSQDDAIEAMSPVEIVRAQSQWEFGDPSWANRFARWMSAAGAKPNDFLR